MMTGVEIWGLEGGWKEIEKVHDIFCKRIFGLPSTAAKGACVRELGRTNRKEKVVERIVKYWKRFTSCNVKVQGSRGTDGWKESSLVYTQR
jgi:hypothetical protein